MTQWVQDSLQKLDNMALIMEKAGMDIVRYEKDQGVDPAELRQLEQDLGIALPQRLTELLKNCQTLTYLWDFPSSAMAPRQVLDLSGEMGWSIHEVGWWEDPTDMDSIGETNGRRYITFGGSGAGDPLMLDLNNGFDDPPVVCFLHEYGEIVQLATGLESYIHHIIELYGAWFWIWTDVADEQGINLSSQPVQQWQEWMTHFIDFSLEDATNLDLLIDYTLYHGIEQEKVQRAFRVYDKNEIFKAWYKRFVQDPSHLSDWIGLMGPTAKEGAADWVRTLWVPEVFEAYLSGAAFSGVSTARTSDQLRTIRANASYASLPEKEALERIFHDLESQEIKQKKKINGYTAYAYLGRFKSPRVINWMKDWINYPIDGWDSLLASSEPTLSILLDWLEDTEICQEVAIASFQILLNTNSLPTMSDQDIHALNTKLEHIQANAVLNIYKKKIGSVLGQLYLK